jgi:BirA family transcriptional regulator, biotin operon repressor / biotin---[acetyl-CoA-carboxylase] ligase
MRPDFGTRVKMQHISRLGRERTQVYHRACGIVQDSARFFGRISARWVGRDIIPSMNSAELSTVLAGLALGAIRLYERTGSTNDEAARWAEAGAPDLALVIADEQTAGKGRQGRKWFTPAGAALAFSLVLRQATANASVDDENYKSPASFTRLTALGALAICEALRTDYGIGAEIKWPNDVLVERKKLAGILAEATWQGDQLQAVILGIGINIAPESVPGEAELIYPATCVQSVLGRPVDRLEVLRAVIVNLLKWRTRLNEDDFLTTWDRHLAFKGEWVTIFENDPGGARTRQGCVLGLDDQGRLRLKDHSGEEFELLTGEVRLRPAAS